MSRSAVGVLAAVALLAGPSAACAQGVLAPVPPPTHPAKPRARHLLGVCNVPVVAVGCSVGGAALGAVGDVVGAGVDAVGGAAMNGLANWVGDGASWLIGRIARLVERSTRPDLAAPWFQARYRTMLSLSLVAALGFLLVALAHAALRQDVEAALRAALIALPTAVLCGFAAVTLVGLALAATDEATLTVTSAAGGDGRAFLGELANILKPGSIGQPAMPGFIMFLSALVAALLCFVVWIELILREAAIYLAVAFLPLSLAAMVWHRTGHLIRRLVEGLAGVILAKLTIGASIALAASAMGHATSSGGGFTSLLAGCAVLFLAALSPWVVFRLIPVAADQVSLHRGSVRRAVMSAPGAMTAATVVLAGMRMSFAGGGAAAAANTPSMPQPASSAGAAVPLRPLQQRRAASPEKDAEGSGRGA